MLSILQRWISRLPPPTYQDNSNDNRDIYHTAWLLRQKLVPDLVPSVLEFADMYATQSFVDEQSREVTESVSPQTCVMTSQITSQTRIPNPVRYVDFRILSKDQGWCSFPQQGSWSWFTVAICKQDQDLAVTHERELVRNPVAGRQHTRHVIRWSADSDDPDEAAWVRGIRLGDSIVVRAWARYGGWVNHVKEVEVECSLVVITR